MNRLTFLKKAAVLTSAIPVAGLLTRCGTDDTATPPVDGSAPVATGVLSPTVLALIQTAATVATGAVLDFAVKQASSRTQLANQIYSAAEALYQASGGTPLTPDALGKLLNSFSLSSVAQYASYVTGIQALYSTYYTKYITQGSVGVQNFAGILNAIAAGAEAGAGSYETVSAHA